VVSRLIFLRARQIFASPAACGFKLVVHKAAEDTIHEQGFVICENSGKNGCDKRNEKRQAA